MSKSQNSWAQYRPEQTQGGAGEIGAIVSGIVSRIQTVTLVRVVKTNPKVDELLEKGRFSTDPAEREAVYTEVQQIVRDEAPWVFMIFNENASATGANVKGFMQHPAGHYRLYPVYFE